MTHNPFDFVKSRVESIEPSPEDYAELDLYMVNVALSMSRDSRVVNALNITNSMKFSRLEKHTQCWALTSLDGCNTSGKWALPKRNSKKEVLSYIDKIMFLFDCSYNDALSMCERNLLDTKLVNDTYHTLTDEKIK